MTLLALEVVASEASERQAASLIKRDRVKDPEAWDPPTAEKENQLIETKGWEVFGRWFLGREENADPETKGAYKYPYSSDFANVDRKGLVAIRQRAGQTDEKEIFDAAGRLLGLIEEPEPVSTRERGFRVAFRKKRPYEIDADSGRIYDVSLIQIGEAKGHGIFIDEQSLDSGLVALGESNLPAYVTHEGAIESDRLLNEIGVFFDFYVDEGKLKAKEFKALGSFMGDDPARFRRLFDLASEAPDAFGISLVFEADLVWTFEDGSEKSITESDGKGAIREIPSVRFRSISSADFVDAPAANDEGLFKSKPDKPRTLRDVIREELKLQQGETMDEAIEKQEELALEEKQTEEVKLDEEAAEESTEESTEQGTLDVEEEVDRLRDDMGRHADRLDMLEDAIADLKERLASAKTENEELAEENEKLSKKSNELSAMVAGEEPLEEAAGESAPGDSIVEQFNNASGAEQTRIWKQNRKKILASFRRD